MPTIACRSTIRAAADLYAVSLNVRHHLVVGKPSDMTHHTTTRFPEDVDVLASNLPIAVSGSFDGCKISAADVATSYLAQHIASYFRTVNFIKYHLGSVLKLNPIRTRQNCV